MQYIRKVSLEMFDVFSPMHMLDDKYKEHLSTAAKLLNIGSKLSFYKHRHHSFKFVLSNLEYGFSHFDRLLISMCVKYHGKRFSGFDDDEFFEFCRKNEATIKWLSIILTIAESINIDMSEPKVEFKLENDTLKVRTMSRLYICSEKLRTILKDMPIKIDFQTI